MITLPPTSTLQPDIEGRLHLFPSTATELLRLDFLYEAGYAYQVQPLVAAATCRLMTLATQTLDSASLAQFLDYRGIVVECNNDLVQSQVTFYLLRRHLPDLLPIVGDLLRQPAFAADDLRTWQARKYQEILAAEQRTSVQARRLFYETLFGTDHPLGTHAVATDALALTTDLVRAHFARYYTCPTAVVLSGNTAGLETELNDLCESIFPLTNSHSTPLSNRRGVGGEATLHLPLPQAVQTSVRVGRVLPLAWDDPDYATLMLAVTALGGYFGSRLMSNIREEKGYTYGIYARTQLYRGVIVFYITADVAAGTATETMRQIRLELQRLCEEPLSDEEFSLVRTVFAGDFLRSVDGVFERAQRHCDMLGTWVDERLTDHLRLALQEATPEELRRVAAAYLHPDAMVFCSAGI